MAIPERRETSKHENGRRTEHGWTQQASVGDDDHSVSDQLVFNRPAFTRPWTSARARTARSSGNSEAHVRAACVGLVISWARRGRLGLCSTRHWPPRHPPQCRLVLVVLRTRGSSCLLPRERGAAAPRFSHSGSAIPRAAWLVVARSASPARSFMRVFTAAAWTWVSRWVWFGSRERRST